MAIKMVVNVRYWHSGIKLLKYYLNNVHSSNHLKPCHIKEIYKAISKQLPFIWKWISEIVRKMKTVKTCSHSASRNAECEFS